MSKRTTKEQLKEHNLAPHKRFGQNFLVNPSTADSIAHSANISAEDIIIEVGVGLGALTAPLASRAQKVIGIEIDSGLIRYHNEQQLLPENVELIHGDILKTNFQELRERCGKPLKIVANLPYSISNPFIFTIIDNRVHVERVVVMLQKEMADRLSASPSTKEYGIPTVLLGGCAKVKKLFTLKPHEFHPQPKIDSTVIAIDFVKDPRTELGLPDFDFSLFRKLVRAAFAQRRKTLINNLLSLSLFTSSGNREENKKGTIAAIEAAGISPKIRAETLSIKDFADLTNATFNRLHMMKE